MLKEKTKITTVGNSKYFLIPESIFNDSAFPFQEGKELEIEIQDKKVMIE